VSERESRHETRGTKVSAGQAGGAVAVTVRCQGSTRIEARLHEISTSGGVIFLDEAIEERTHVMLVFENPAGLIKENAEMLPPHWATKGCLQPFRFTDPNERSQRRLQGTMSHLLGSKS
jgi:hypothetical protein